MNFLSDKDKEIISGFIKHQLSVDDFDNLKYKLCDDFIGHTEDDVRKYHIGMRWILEMMLHQIPLYPNEQEAERIIKSDMRTFDEL